jgi:hypothetical protein
MKIQSFLVVGLLAQLAYAGLFDCDYQVNPLTEPPNSVPSALTSDVDAERDANAPSRLAVFKRDEARTAKVYTSNNCSGDAIVNVDSFGCDSTICTAIVGGFSVRLAQNEPGSPAPSAKLFYKSIARGSGKQNPGPVPG